jgi:hypothetical protein
MPYYLDSAKCGYLSPEIQMRNLKLFGDVTSEGKYRKQHEAFMQEHREQVNLKNSELEENARKLVAQGKKMQWLKDVWNNGTEQAQHA